MGGSVALTCCNVPLAGRPDGLLIRGSRVRSPPGPLLVRAEIVVLIFAPKWAMTATRLCALCCTGATATGPQRTVSGSETPSSVSGYCR